MTGWLKLAADICLSPYSDVASLESLSSSAAGDTGVIVATVAPEKNQDTQRCSHELTAPIRPSLRSEQELTAQAEIAGDGNRVGSARTAPMRVEIGQTRARLGASVEAGSNISAFAPQGASQGVSSGGGLAVAKSSEHQTLPADSQVLTRGVNIQSSAAPTEFQDCLYCNQRTVHCQAHARCLSCGEGCRECAVSGLSSNRMTAAQCETSGECGGPPSPEQGMAGSVPSGVDLSSHPLRNEHSPLERCNECYFFGCPCAGPGVCGCKCHSQSANDPPAGIPTFDEEYGRTYRGRLFTGNTIEELFCAVIRAEQGARG